MRKLILSLVVLLSLFAGLDAQESITLEPSKDNTIYSEDKSNGEGIYLFAGRTKEMPVRRALVYFDLNESVPAGAQIDSVFLSMNVNKGQIQSATPVMVHRLNKAWGEGQSKASANEGQGAASADDDASWTYRRFNTDSWSVPGGDFESGESSMVMISGNGPVQWSGTGLVEDVKLWLGDESKNHGWILIGDEGVPQSVKRFASRENTNAQERPKLTIYYSVVTSNVLSYSGSGQALNAYPNPFIDDINITYQIGKKEMVQLGIYNLLGQRIEVLSRSVLSPGNYHSKWDGTDRSGKHVPNGMYYVILETGEDRQVNKIMKTR